MLDIHVKEPGIIQIELNGEIDAAAMESGLNRLVELCEDLKNGKLFYRISDFKMPTLAALGVEFMMLPKLFGLISKVDKAAVLTNEGWIAKASVIEGALIPGLEIRAFGLEEEGAAMDFLKGG
ncbi:MAG: STAS/SEC14 domain-containing protein [Rhizobiaceae bacterium]|nr:STAS/SEC14 domain-containing protein [Rhizobiaceae bacterium]